MSRLFNELMTQAFPIEDSWGACKDCHTVTLLFSSHLCESCLIKKVRKTYVTERTEESTRIIHNGQRIRGN